MWDIRDYWMMSFEGNSPFRPYFHWAIMPTVDSAPQKEEWIDAFAGADSVHTYSDWGLEVLNEQSRNRINTIQSAPPGVHLDVYKPVSNKSAHREKMGFAGDCNIIGTLMRNQVRKLYPDLMDAFRKFLDKCYADGNVELAQKTYLYIHTSYPDVGWDLPKYIKQYELGHKIIFSYICQKCERPFCSLFQDSRTVCPHCNSVLAVLPNVSQGFSEQHLSDIFNMFDVYIQYAVAEGFGMAQPEATACGVPIMSVDYSAMSDVVNKTEGWPIPPDRMFHDLGTGSLRALPNNQKCADMMYDIFQLPKDLIRRKGYIARKATEKYYNWDRTADIWANHFRNIELTGNQGKWDAPKTQYIIPEAYPHHKEMSNVDFMDWVILNVMHEPDKVRTKFSMDLLQHLNYGGRMNGKKTEIVSRQTIYNDLKEYAQNKLECESVRVGEQELVPMDFIEYAHNKAALC